MRVGRIKLALAALGLAQVAWFCSSGQVRYWAAQAQGPTSSAVKESHEKGPQDKAAHDRSDQLTHDKAGAVPDRANQDRTFQDKANQDKTAQDKSDKTDKLEKSEKNKDKSVFSGHWEALGHPDGIDFDLELKQHGAKISGHHMAVNFDGTKIDGFQGDEPPSVDGEIRTGSKEADLQFKSSFASTPGKARIKLRGKRMIWTVTSPPEGNYYLPGEAVLVRTGS